MVSALLDYISKDSMGSTVNYDLVQRRVLDLRKSAELPWNYIVDESRASYGVSRWNNPAGFAETAPWFYRLDFWREQNQRPLVLVEKAGQIPVYMQHARGLGVDVAACKGYGSASYLRSVALSVNEHICEGQAIHLLVCADFDPSGDDWPRAALEEIQSHVSNPDLITMQRVLVTRDDLDDFGAQVALRGANKNDSRTKRFLERHGFTPDQEVCVEMDAMSPAVARDRIEAAVMGMFSGDLEAEVQLQQEHRDRIVQVLEGLV
ncbi:hypothetical protein SynBIOSE41_01085 [Synechococcus sp. BIOS-E4-1]|uniref:hypothetical protein n=1 Tax=Synechococcus sp. BIOS-E4-1 TaxID=1400864 RepID=UPI0016494586|nr:hypothetical protein [Synechococcus sp. BIOS-E4-1]QNI53606.1 hypothetical protein SynBIOSE41_01085 [Synechococcus sp. BIOS-E4-1]